MPPPAPPIVALPEDDPDDEPLDFPAMPKADVVRWWIMQDQASRSSMTGPHISNGVFRDTRVDVSTKTCTNVRKEFE